MKPLLTLILAFTLSAMALHAQLPTLRNFSTLDYGAGTQNWGVDIDEGHEVLFANNNGLMGFDSYKWRILQVPNYTNVRSLYFDSKLNRTYVGATDEFGYFSGDKHTGHMDYHSLSAPILGKGHAFGEIWCIAPVGTEITFQAKNSLFVMGRNGKVREYPIKFRIENASAAAGALYISCKEAIYRYQGGQLALLQGTEALQGMNVRSVLSYRGKLLFVTDNHGLYLYDGHETSAFVLDVSPLLIANQVYCAAISNRYLAFGTVRGGLIVKNLATGENYFVNSVSGLANNTVLSMRFDSLNNIWLGLDNGIAYVMLGVPCRDLLGPNNSVGTGYASLVTGNSLYLGTNQGLFRMSLPLQNSMKPLHPTMINGLGGQIWSISLIGSTLLCGSDAGAYVIDGDEAIKINGLGGTWTFLPIKGHDGYVLASDYMGFAVLKREGAGYVVCNRVDGITLSTQGIYCDADGSFWASDWQRGIYHFRLSGDLTKTEGLEYFNHANGLPTDDNNLVCLIDGHVVISSVDGFHSYDPKTRKLLRNEKLNKVFDTYGASLRVIETPSGDLWAYKPTYLAIAHKLPGGGYKVQPFAYNNIVAQLQMSLGHIGFLDDHHTIMNNENGYYVIQHQFVNTTPPTHLFVRRIISTNKRDTLLFEYAPGVDNAKLKVPHDLNSLRIEFVMPELREDHAVDYQYRLEGYDSHWSAKSTANSKEYTHLPKGSYSFRLKGTNRLTGATLETSMLIEVLPAWYETWWATLLWFILVILIIIQLLKWFKRRADREVVRVNREKERQLREQQAHFKIEEQEKEKELIRLRNEHLEVELKHKSSQLADSTMNLVRKNDILQEIDHQMEQLADDLTAERSKASLSKAIRDIRRSIKHNIEDDDNWEKFEENFNLVNDNYMVKLTKRYPTLKINDCKLCAYLYMELSSKEMAALLNTSVRSIETARYRLRKKLGLDQGQNLTDFIKNFGKEENES